MEYKQCIIIRVDLGMSRGKIAAQAAHASLAAYEKTPLSARVAWKNEGQKKVVLKAGNLNELLSLHREAEKAGLPTALITDAGLTQLEPGTVTALGVGPAPSGELDRIFGKLKLL